MGGIFMETELQCDVVESSVSIEGYHGNVYGLRIALDGKTSVINDITPDKGKAEHLRGLIVKNGVTHTTFFEIVEDYVEGDYAF